MKEKIVITNNHLIGSPNRHTPLVQTKDGELVLDKLFITDVNYAKYLIPVIKVVDKIRSFFKRA